MGLCKSAHVYLFYCRIALILFCLLAQMACIGRKYRGIEALSQKYGWIQGLWGSFLDRKSDISFQAFNKSSFGLRKRNIKVFLVGLPKNGGLGIYKGQLTGVSRLLSIELVFVGHLEGSYKLYFYGIKAHLVDLYV